jgi:hypothetical protein
MDDWHRKIAAELVQETWSGAGLLPDASAALEVAFGKARSAITYVLEVARAHRIPASGSVVGDDVWLQLGDGRVRFTLNRREGHVVVVRSGQDEVRVRAGDLETQDVGTLAHAAIDALVAAWRARPPQDRRPSAPPPDFEDEPTKKG